ncbi:unnamed protein product, partial [Rhizoctonia solani]
HVTGRSRDPHTQTLAQTRPGVGTATHAQNLGYLRVLNIGRTLRRASDNTDNLSENSAEYSKPSASTASNAMPSSVHRYLCPTPDQIQAHNLSAVEFEFNQYIAHGTILLESTGAIDLIEYWKAH